MIESTLKDLERCLFDPDAQVDGDEIEDADLDVLVTRSEEAGEFGTVLSYLVRPGLSRGLVEIVLSQTAGYRELIY